MNTPEPAAELQLITAVQKAALEPTTAERLVSGFAPFFRDAKAILDVSRHISVTDATQVTEIKASRENRLKLRAVRVAADKARAALKEDSKRLGDAIQGVYNLLLVDVASEEKRLQEAEEFAERAEAARKEKLKAERIAALASIDDTADLTGYDLSAMSEASFANVIASTKLVVETRLEAARKTEEARIESARIAAEEAARKEAERLAQVAEANRLAAEAAEQARIANEAREKAEVEARAAAEAAAAELARVEAAAKAEREAAAAEAKRLADEARAEQLKRDAEIIAQRAAEKAERDRLQAIADAAAAEEAKRIAAERAESERLRKAAEAEAARLAKAESDRLAAIEAAARAAAAAPAKAKIEAYAAAIRAVPVPDIEQFSGKIGEQAGKFSDWVLTLTAKL